MLSLAPIPLPSFAGPEGRAILRKSMLVAATLKVGQQVLGVRIRNMSPTGALIEGAVLPLPDTRIELVRGPLGAAGRIAWVEGGRCGIALDGRVDIDCWLSGKQSAHQASVDEMVEEVRRNLVGAESDRALIEPESGIGRDSAAAAEIDQIVAILSLLGERLTDDTQVVATHAVDLQAIDEVQQRLAGLKRRLS